MTKAPARITELPVFQLNRITTDSERTYDAPIGLARSVTTILDATRDRAALEQWRESVGHKRADEIRDMAAWRGTKTHEMIEHFLMTREEPEYHFTATPYWKSLKSFVTGVDAPLIMEAPVWHPDGYAGTLDCLAYLYPEDVQPTLIDWKTADKPLKPWKLYEYSVQLAAYRQAANHVYEPYGLQINKAVIAIGLPDEYHDPHWLDEEALDQLYQHFLGRLQRFIRTR